MTSEAHRLGSPAPAISVRARAKEIEARSGAAAAREKREKCLAPPQSPPPVAPRPAGHTRHQVKKSTERHLPENPPPARGQRSPSPSRRSSEGDLFLRCRPRQQPPQDAPRLRRTSLEHHDRRNLDRLLSPPRLWSVTERQEGSGSAAESTTSKFAPFTADGKSGVTCPTRDFRPAIFSASLLPTSVAAAQHSPLDDIIDALEKICDEFDEAVPGSATRSDHEANGVLPERSLARPPDAGFPASHGVNDGDESQWLFERVPGRARCQDQGLDVRDARRKASEAVRDQGLCLDREFLNRRDTVVVNNETEPPVYRSTLLFSPSKRNFKQERHIVSTTIHISPPQRQNINTVAGDDTDDTGIVLHKSPKKNEFAAQDRCCQTSECIENTITKEIFSFRDDALEEQAAPQKSPDFAYCKPKVIPKPDLPATLISNRRLSDNPLHYKAQNDEGQSINYDNSPSKELEIVRNILANLDFAKYKRRPSLEAEHYIAAGGAMENKSPRPPRSQKSSSVKLKDFFDLLRPSSDHSTSSSSKHPLKINRSSSFSNAEGSLESPKETPTFFLGNEQNEVCKDSCNSPVPDEPKKTSTLPRIKSPSRRTIKKVTSPPPVPAVASCPSIVKLDPKLCDAHESDSAHDEGLVSDSEAGPGAYVAAYVSCVTSGPDAASSFTSGRRGHVRSASDNVTSATTLLPEMLPKKVAGSTEKLWSGTEKRKRRKGEPGTGPNQEPAKSGRSLTYPPQRKSSTSEEEQEYSSVDSNGLKSLKLLTAGLHESGNDAVRLLSDLSLADSHLCPSEGTFDETYQDVVDSVMQSPSDTQHLAVDDRSSTSGNGKPHKKKHHSDPGGEACCSGSSDAFMTDVIGASRSEPDLGANDVITPSSSCSSASSEPSSRADHSMHHDHDHRHHNLKLVIDSKAVRDGQCISLTTGAAPHSRFQFPDADGTQRGSGDPNQMPRSPQEQRRYSKRRLRGPYGEMLEEEMRKSGEKQKPAYSDLSFLTELCDSRSKSEQPAEDNSNNNNSNNSGTSASQQNRQAMFLSSQSLDDASSGATKSDSTLCVTPKRKISANFPLLTDAESAMLGSDDVMAPKSQSAGGVNGVEDATDSGKNSKDNYQTLTDSPKIQDRHSDTRTHVVGELYDTEKSYVESLQILANKYMKPLKSPEHSGMVETGLVDEIFFQIPEILSHHEIFLESLKQRLTTWDSKQKVGDVFVEAFTKQPVIDTYTAFINNWKSAKDAIKLASQAKPSFARFLEHMSREHKGKLTLDALLIMPVQRIPRYELLIKELLKHTHVDHPDHHLLVLAQKEVHDLAVKINRMEREAFQQEQMQQRVREIEQLIDGVMDLVQPDRDFIRHDMVSMPGGLGTKKERCLFLFSDVLLITSMKRKSGTMRKTSSASSGSPNSFSSLEMNKYKLLTRFSLDNLDVSKNTDSNLKKAMKDIEHIEEDVALLNQMGELIGKLNTHHQVLDDAVKEAMTGMTKQLAEKQNADSQLVSLELTVTSQEGVDSLTIQFASPEKRASWEAAFNEAKQKLALSTDRRPPPEFMHPLPIRKTRAGLQFTCATATLGFNQQGLRDVWVCNSDGYVGQVCVLSLMPEPTVMSCNGVCNARILTIASIPAASPHGHHDKSRWRSTLPDNMTGVSIEVEEVVEEYDEERINNGNIQLDSDSSEEDEDDTESTDDEKSKEEGRKRGGSVPREDCQDDMDNRQPTMWLGTEDGCIHVYNCNDNIRTKKNKIKIQHSAAIHCIIYLDNRVFVSLANGDVCIYKKEIGGGWNTNEPQKVTVGSASAPVTRMLAVAGKLWCGCQNTIHVLNTLSLQVEHSFSVSSDATRTVLCMVTSGLGVWVALHHSAILRLFHATSYECLLDVNVAPAVTKMLAGSDDIIRQHKAACLRVTAMLACKDLLWVGTSAGVILNLPLPHLTSSTASLDDVPNVSGLPYGHTGHVRFLTCVETTPGTSLDLPGYGKYAFRALRAKDCTASGRRASTSATAGCRLLVISGGDGYEDFHNSGLGEAAGRDDSTNHLLLWQV